MDAAIDMAWLLFGRLGPLLQQQQKKEFASNLIQICLFRVLLLHIVLVLACTEVLLAIRR